VRGEGEGEGRGQRGGGRGGRGAGDWAGGQRYVEYRYMCQKSGRWGSWTNGKNEIEKV
jgi:hypothetical protein